MIYTFDNFLPDDLAENLYNGILDSRGDWWRTARIAMSNGSSEANYTDSTIRQRSEDWEQKLTESLRSNLYTYQFTRSVDHFRGCGCVICNFETYLDYVLKEWIETHTDLENIERNFSFVSIYNRGDFLSTHTDRGRGDVAFVINLTKDWRPEYGGMFHSNGQYVEPKFNSLMLMMIPPGGVDHFVSEVSHRAPGPRIAVSGWFKSK